MKTVLALILAIGCAVAAPPYLKRGGYKLSGKYIYNYTALMKVKLVDEKIGDVKTQYTKLFLNSTIALHFLPENDQVLLKIETFNITEVVKDPKLGGKIGIPSNLSEIMEEFLILPVKFGYKYGLVNKVFAKAGDPEWSVNYKKSIINLFHVDIQGKDEETMMNTLFTKPEISVFGICNTTYQMMDFATFDGAERTKVGMNITKVIDVENCTYQKTDVVNTVMQHKMEKMERSPLETSVMIEYDIIGNEFKFKIEAVTARGLYAIFPFSRKDGSILAVTYQRLTLIKESGSLVKLNNPTWLEDLKERGKLTVAVPPIEEPDFLWQWKEEDWDRLVDFVYERLVWFVKDFSPEWEPTVAMKNLTDNETETILTIVNSLRLCKEKHLEKIWNKVEDRSRHFISFIYRQWFIYLLTMCHTEECTKFMVNNIKTRDISPKWIEEYLMAEGFTGRTTRKQVETVFELCSLNKIESVPQLKTVCYVTTSNLVKTLCKTNPVCETPFEKKILELLKKLEKCQLEKKECLYIEKIPATILLTLAENIMLKQNIKPEFFAVLEKIILREELPLEIRVKAMWACRPLIKIMPHRIRILMMKLFHDTRYNLEIRITAFAVIMENPTPALIDICARRLFIEPSLHVRKYVFEYIKGVAKTKPYFKYSRSIIYTCQLCIKSFWRPVVKVSYTDLPRHYEEKMMIKPYKYGYHWTWDSVITNSSFIPKFIQSRLNLTLFGRNIPVFDGEVRMEGIQEYLIKIFGPDGSFYKKKSVFDFIRRKPRSIDEYDEYDDDIKESTAGAIPRPDEELKLFSQVKLFDKIFFVNYTSLASNIDLKDLFMKGSIFRAVQLEDELKKGKVFNWFKPIVPLDVVYKLPTLLGFPLHCNLTSITIPRMKTTVKAEVKPRLFSISTLLSSKRESAEIEIKHNVSAVSQVIGSVFFSLPVYEVGVRMKFSENISAMFTGRASLNFKDMKSKIEFDLPQQTRDLVTLKREVFHFIKPYPTKKTKVPTNITIIKVEPFQVGELVIVNVTKPYNNRLYEEWILKTKDGKVLSVKDNSIIADDDATVFRIFFHGRSRNHISIFVPKVGFVTMSRKSRFLIVNPMKNRKGKVFEIEYKNLTSIVLKTWARMEKKMVPKEWPSLNSESLLKFRQEFEMVRQVFAEHNEDMVEKDELPWEKEHLRRVYVGIVNGKLGVTPDIKEALELNITKVKTYENVLREVALNNSFCFGTYYNMKICLMGYFSHAKWRPAFKASFGPLLLKLRIIPLKEMPEKLCFKSEVQNIDKKNNVPVLIHHLAKIITIKGDVAKTRVTIQTRYDLNLHRNLRIDIIPADMQMLYLKKMCIERSYLKDGVSLWASMEENCQVKHLQMEMVNKPFFKVNRKRHVLTARFNYTSEKLPYLWQAIINGTLKWVVRPSLFVASDRSFRMNNTERFGVKENSAIVEFKLTSNATVKTAVKTPRRTFICDRTELPFYIDMFPKGSVEIPWFWKMDYMTQPHCNHRNNTFLTVDGKVYNYKLRGECEHVLMQNCSANMTNFMVLIRKIPGNKVTRAIRVIVGDMELDITPQVNWRKKPYVQLDGQDLKFETAHWKYDSMNRPVFAIIWEPELKNIYFQHFKLGLTLGLFHSWRIRAMVHPLLYGKICGLCGNFDAEEMNDFGTPENTLVQDPTLFGSSWIVPGLECGDLCTKEKIHKEIELKESRICKTSIPVAQCLQGCKATVTEKAKVPSLCVPKSEANRIALDDRLLYKKTVMIKDLKMETKEVDIPLKCSCACENKRKWKEEDEDDLDDDDLDDDDY